MTVSLKLKKPIRHGDDEILMLEFREPTAKDIKNLGYPVTMKEEVDAGVIFNYTVALTNLPPSVISQISARDFVQITGIVAGFFGDSEDRRQTIFAI